MALSLLHPKIRWVVYLLLREDDRLKNEQGGGERRENTPVRKLSMDWRDSCPSNPYYKLSYFSDF
jgi:hypothetical protein